MRYEGANSEGYERDITILAESFFQDPTFEEARQGILDLATDYKVDEQTVRDDLEDIVEAIGSERTGQALNFTQS